jgi:hypothetical protein
MLLKIGAAAILLAAAAMTPGHMSGPVVVSGSGLNWPGTGSFTGKVCSVGDGLCVTGTGNPPPTCTQNLDNDVNGNNKPDIGDTISCTDSL